MQKKDWVHRIEQSHANGEAFVARVGDDNKAPLIFATDVFRRKRYDVKVSLEASPTGAAVLHVCIPPYTSALEFTLRRDQSVQDVLACMRPSTVHVVTIRGCGTVINAVCKIAESAIHNGWYIDNTVINTLTQTGLDFSKHRNTTLLMVLRRGSDIDSI